MYERRFVDLGYFLLGAVGFRDFEVDAFDAARGVYDFDAV